MSEKEMIDLVFDKTGVLERLDNDRELLDELVVLLFEDADRYVETLHVAANEKDQKTLQSEAHSIKGALGNVGAAKARICAGNLEMAGRNGNLEGVVTQVEELKKALSEFQKVYQADKSCR